MKRSRFVPGMLVLAIVCGAAFGADKAAPAKGEAIPAGSIAHSVYFWLKKDATDEDLKALIADCKGLATLDGVLKIHVGTPLGKGRGVVDGSYQVGLVVYFADKAAYDGYIPHPKHQALVKKHRPLWDKVIVYDFVMQ